MGDLILEIDVDCFDAVHIKGNTRDIVMIPFTGKATGPYFSGSVIGEGVDTQKIGKDGECVLSARYALEGRDAEGQTCRVFIENQGSDKAGFHPMIVTDSKYLAKWETMALSSTITPKAGGVIVRIYADS